MLALPLTLALSLTAPGATPLENAAVAVGPVVQQTQAMVPYGSAVGSWIAGTLLEDGIMVALLEDALGRPLWALDATISATGHVTGELVLLEYASNPAIGYLPLEVVGQADIPAEGVGSFSLVIHCPLLDDGYVYPLGRIEGILTRGMRRVLQSSVAPGQAELAPNVLRNHVIVCPKAPSNPLEVARRGQLAPTGQAGGVAPGGGVIVCPYAPGHLASQTQLGAVGAAGRAVTSFPPDVYPGTPMGNMGHATHTTPVTGEGRLSARWILYP